MTGGGTGWPGRNLTAGTGLGLGTRFWGWLDRVARRYGTQVLGFGKFGSGAVESGTVDGCWTANVGEGRKIDEAEDGATLPAEE